MRIDKSIDKFFLFGMIFVALVSIAISGTLTISYQYQKFITDSDSLRNEYIETQKALMKNEVEKVFDYIEYMKSKTQIRLREEIKERTYEAYHIALNIYNENIGQKGPGEIKKLITDALRPIRFNDGRGYFFAVGSDGVCHLFADHTELEGKNLVTLQDTQGKYVVRDMISLVKKNGEGFYRYTWTKPEKKGSGFPKITYIKYLEPLDWIIGTGEYLDDVESDIKKEILDRIGKIRFGSDGYVFVVNFGGVTLINPMQPKLNGKNIWDITDPNGVKIVQEERKAVENPEGDFIHYIWEKPTEKKPVPKITFMKGMHEWQWMIGAGVYVDEIENVIQARKDLLRKEVVSEVFKILLVLIFLMLLIYCLAWLLSYKIKKGFNVFSDFFENAARKSVKINPEDMHFKEFKNLAVSANRMVETRTHVEKSLRQSEARYRFLTEKMADIIWIIDLDLKIVYVSPSVERVLGYTPKDRKNLTHEKVLTPESLTTVRKMFAEELQREKEQKNNPNWVMYLEAEYFRKDGTTVWLENSVKWMRDNKGEITGIYGVSRDITKRKTAEAETLAAKSFLDTLLDMSPFSMWVADTEGNIIRTNRSLRNAMNISSDDGLIEKYNLFRDANLDKQGVRDAVVAVFKEKKPLRFSKPWLPSEEGNLDFKGAKDLYLDVSMFPILNADGELESVVAQWVDITEQKHAEKALEAREEHLRAIFKAADNVAFVTTDIRGEDTRILEFSPGAEKIFGYTSREIFGRQVALLHPPEAINELVETHRGFRLGNKGQVGEATLVRKSGDRFPAIFSIHPLFDGAGTLIGTVEVTIDVSEKMKLEAQLSQAQKMESVGRLAGGVAHDYNNALGIIIGYTEMVIEDVSVSDEVKTNLRQSLAAAKHAKEITGQLLAFASKQTIVPRIIELNKNVESLLNMLTRLIGEDILLEWQPGEDVRPVKIDPAQVDQMLVNLCINSRDAMSGVGKIVMQTENVCFDVSSFEGRPDIDSGEFVMLSVSDNGCGMDKEVLNNIFEPFFTTKDLDKGTGLGMATVYGIVRQNNGFIDTYSEPGIGTCINIYLPAHQGKLTPTPKRKAPETLTGGKETILLVEDEAVLLGLTKITLTSLGYQVLTADTPGEALAQAKNHPAEIHLLITDVIMPEMNGRELSEQLQEIYPDLQCLFMSGYTADIIADHGVLEEGTNFIQKPFHKKDLAAAVRRILDEHES